MQLTIVPGVVSVPTADQDGKSMQGRTVAFRAMFTPGAGQGEIDITDKADWESSNPLVLMFVTKSIVRDPRGRVVGSQADFRLVNHGTATVAAHAQGLTATSRVTFGIAVPPPAAVPVPVAPSTGAWAGLAISGGALLLGAIFAAVAGRAPSRAALPPAGPEAGI